MTNGPDESKKSDENALNKVELEENSSSSSTQLEPNPNNDEETPLNLNVPEENSTEEVVLETKKKDDTKSEDEIETKHEEQQPPPPQPKPAEPEQPQPAQSPPAEQPAQPAQPSEIDLKPLKTPLSSCRRKSVRFSQVDIFEFERCQGFGSIPGQDAPSNQTITLGMQLKHEWKETFESVEDYLKAKRRSDLSKLEAYVKKRDMEIENGENIGQIQTDNIDPFYLEGIEMEREKLERAKIILTNREQFESDITLDLNLDPDILCPILSNKERLEKLANVGMIGNKVDKKEAKEVTEILKSREVIFIFGLYIYFSVTIFKFFFLL